jgi:hypothetical protein
MKLMSSVTSSMIKPVSIIGSFFLLCAIVMGQGSVNLKKYLPTQEEIPDYDISKIKLLKQKRNASSESIGFDLIDRDKKFLLGITIGYAQTTDNASSLVDSIFRNNPGNTWRKGFRFSPSVGTTSAHTETVKGKPESSIQLLSREGRAIIMIRYSKQPTGSTLKSVEYPTLSQADIKRVENLLVSILQKMRRDGLTK